MSSSLSYRPSTRGDGRPTDAFQRKASLSSFPPAAKAQSIMSHRVALSSGSAQSGLQGPFTTSPQESNAPSLRKMLSQESMGMVPRPPRSQYPPESAERHVEYILVASFDIDKGSIMEHQFPAAISGDENMLAELMLPDQAHARKEDWTIFFLHKDIDQDDEDADTTSSEEGEQLKKQDSKENAKLKTSDNSQAQEELDDDDEGPPLIYVLNLVNTKHDVTAKRGAVVKAMAICTRHPFLHIYKPLLLLALEEYYKAPNLGTLESLYNSVNAMDLSAMPKLSMFERQIMLANDTKDLFVEKFELMTQLRSNSISEGKDQRQRHTLPRDTHEYESKVVYNGVPIPIKVPSAVSPETVGDFSMIKLIQAFHGPHSTTPQPFALHSHLTTSGAYTHPIIVLINAVLTQKRIIFLGHNRPSGEVAEAVLATCALASGGVLKGFTRHAFPYTDLTKIDHLLNVPGFIAGVTNPTFANHPEWWDVLCDIPTGRMKISNKIEAPHMTDGLVYFQQQNPGLPIGAHAGGKDASNADGSRDGAFMESLVSAIASRHGEGAIRNKLRDYITRFTRIAAAFEETVYGASALCIGASEIDENPSASPKPSSSPGPEPNSTLQDYRLAGLSGHGYVWSDEATKTRELAANSWRIEGWRNTRSYYALIQDIAASWERRPIRNIDLAHQHDRLRCQKLSTEESAAIYLAFSDTIQTYGEICQLLSVVPQGKAGLFYIALGTFHPSVLVRQRTVSLLERIIGHEAGRHFWTQMNRFQKQGFMRARKAREQGNSMMSISNLSAGSHLSSEAPIVGNETIMTVMGGAANPGVMAASNDLDNSADGLGIGSPSDETTT